MATSNQALHECSKFIRFFVFPVVMIKQLQFKDEASWLEALTQHLTQIVSKAVSQRGVAHIALSGGSTPKVVYSFWNQKNLPWDDIRWWLGDERWVPADSESSNEKMVFESLAKGKEGFKKTFHSWHLADQPVEASLQYEKKLTQSLGTPPAFDLVLLGLGTDGHTASLFPGSSELNEFKRFAVATNEPHLGSTRLTLTYPALNQARHVWFLVKGNDKKEMVDKLLNSSEEIPAGRVSADDRKLFWLT
jgi:6-phosphogluconolactonase